jgi:hypothetical protein
MAIKTDTDILETLIYCLINQHCIEYMNQEQPINLTVIYRKINTALEYETNLAMREIASKLEHQELLLTLQTGGTKKLEQLILKGRTNYNKTITRMMLAIKNQSKFIH